MLRETLARWAAEKTKSRFGAKPFESSWQTWLREMFPSYFSDGTGQPIPFASFHEELWRWVWALERGTRPLPFIAVWARGAGKSTNAEAATVSCAVRRTRKFGLYVCGTQALANDHLGNIAALIEGKEIERYYPEVGKPRVNKFSIAKGWTQQRLMTASGFTLDALGLDTAARGIKVEDQRPDLIILDDVDDERDSPAMVERKIKAITKKLIPAGSADVAVLGVQNLIHVGSVFNQMLEGEADFLADRIVSGPYPAIRQLAYEQDEVDGRFYIVGGEPTWPEGFGLDRCQRMVDDMGISAFLTECQHEVSVAEGGVFDHLSYPHVAKEDLPDLVRVTVWADPAVGDTDESACQGLSAQGLAADGRIYLLRAFEAHASPEQMLQKLWLTGQELHADSIGIETDNGGDAWRPALNDARRTLLDAEELDPSYQPKIHFAKAGSTGLSKQSRAELMLPDYENGRIVHMLGPHELAERAMKRFPKVAPFDYVDSHYWAWHDLRHRTVRVVTPVVNQRESPWV